MSIFLETCYVKAIKQLVSERKKEDQSTTFQQMSEQTRIPKSYVSKVMNEKADFSSDQLFLVIQYLRLDESRAEYLQLLLDYKRTAVKQRQEALYQKILEFQKLVRDTEKHIQARKGVLSESQLQKYYLDPIHQLVHISLGIEKIQKDYRQLSHLLRITPDRLTSIILDLEGMGLLKTQSFEIELLVESLHLPKSSDLYRPWLNQIKAMSLNNINQSNNDESYSFSVLFSGSERVRTKIHERFLEFLKDIEKDVMESKSERVIQLNFDLLPWI